MSKDYESSALSKRILKPAVHSDCSLQDLLIKAVSSGNIKICKSLIKKGADINACDKDGRSLLHVAVLENQLEMTRFLLEAKINPNLQDNNKDTALHLAQGRENSRILTKLLVDYGGNVSIKNKDNLSVRQLVLKVGDGKLLRDVWGKLYAKDIFNINYLLKDSAVNLVFANVNSIFYAQYVLRGCIRRVTEQDKERVVKFATQQKLIEKIAGNPNPKAYRLLKLFKKVGVDFASYRDPYLIEVAISANNYETIKYLVEENFHLGKDLRLYETFLKLANTKSAPKEIIKLLTDYSSKNELSEKNIAYVSEHGTYEEFSKLLFCGAHISEGLVNIAVINTDSRILEFLLNKFEVKLCDTSGDDLINKAIIECLPDNVELLIRKGASLSKIDKEGNNLLHFAISKASHKKNLILVIRVLIDNKVDINATNEEGLAPFELAIIFSKVEVAKYLLNNGAIFSPKSNNSLIHLATLKNNGEHAIERLNYILDEFPNEFSKINLIAKDGATPLHNIFFYYSVDNIEKPLIFLIKHGANINGVNRMNYTPLQYILKCAYTPARINLLLKYGAIFTSNNFTNESLLHWTMNWAYFNEKIPLSKEIFTKFPSEIKKINSVDQFNETPLFGAVDHDSYEMVKLCLQHGADPNLKLKYHNSAMSHSIKKGNKDIIKLLIEHGGILKSGDIDPIVQKELWEEFVRAKIDKNNDDYIIQGKYRFLEKQYHDAAALFKALLDNDLIELGSILKNNSSIINFTHSLYGTPLLLAIGLQNIDSIKLLLEYGADVNFESFSIELPIHQAIYKHVSLEIVELLIKSGADLNKIPHSKYITALGAALRELDSILDMQEKEPELLYCLKLIELLLESGAIFDLGDAKISQLFYSKGQAHFSEQDYLKEIRSKIAELSIFKTQNSNLNSFYGDSKVINSLIENEKKGTELCIMLNRNSEAKVILKNKLLKNYDSLSSILSTVIICNNIEILKELIEQGINLNMLLSKHLTALDIAIMSKNYILADYLQAYGAFSAKELGGTYIINNFGYDDLNINIIDQNQNINSFNTYGIAPLQMAILLCYYNMAIKLIEEGADVNLVDKDNGYTHLHTAVTALVDSVGIKTVKLLLNRGANKEALNKENQTPLMLALTLGTKKIVDLLANFTPQTKKMRLISANESFQKIVQNKDNKINVCNSEEKVQIIFNQANEIWFAIKNNKPRILESLLKSFDLSLISRENRASYLILACENNYVEVARLLIKTSKIDLNYAGLDYLHNEPPLIYSIKQDRPKITELLLQEGAEPNITNKNGDTALHIASRLGLTKKIKLLFKYKANPNAIDSNCKTALFNTIYSNNVLSVARLLIKNKINIFSKNSSGNQAIEEAQKIQKPIRACLNAEPTDQLKANCDLLIPFLQECAVQKLYSNNLPATNRLFNAIYNNNLKIIKELVEKDQSILCKICDHVGNLFIPILPTQNESNSLNLTSLQLHNRDKTKLYSPLHYASMYSNLESFQYLFEKSNIDVNYQHPIFEAPFLHFAICNYRFEVAKYLISLGADINIQNREDKNLLQIDQTYNNKRSIEIIKFLMENGIDINSLNNKFSPLEYAASRGNVEICEYLLEKGIDIKKIFSLRGNVFFLALSHTGQILDLTKLFLKYNLDINYTKNNESLLDNALNRPYTPVEWFQLVVDAGADPNIRYGDYKLSALHAASLLGAVEVIKVFLPKINDMNMVDCGSYTSLFFATYCNWYDTVKLLLEHEANVNLVNRHLESPIFAAVRNDNLKIVKLLVEHNANIYLRNYMGENILHIAACYPSCEMVEYIINLGLDIDSLTNSRFSPLDCALYNKRQSIINLLVKYGATKQNPEINELEPAFDFDPPKEIKGLRKIAIHLGNHRLTIDYPVSLIVKENIY